MLEWIKKVRDSPIKQVIVIRDDLKLGKGKLCAQVAHAALAGYKKVKEKNPPITEKWEEHGEKKVVLRVSDEREMMELYQKVKGKIPCSLIRDAGLTQIPSGTITCFSIGPWYADEIDDFTKELRLL
jgi:PTH2 family peptidyl-tRNA hydrolase